MVGVEGVGGGQILVIGGGDNFEMGVWYTFMDYGIESKL